MKDKNDNTHQADQSTAQNTDAVKNVKKTKSRTMPLVLTVIAAALIGGGAMWYVQKNQNELSIQYDSQLQALVKQAKKNEKTAKDALSNARNQALEVQRLSKALANTNEQLNDMRAAIQTMTASGSDIILVNDIEQLITLAQQQLMIGGNLANAIVSLETAQSRLAHANRQSLATLLQTINGDLDRLRAVRVTDVATVTAQLNRLKELLNTAPLYVPDSRNSSINGGDTSEDQAVERASEVPVLEDETNAVDLAWWERSLNRAADLTQKSWETVRQDLGQFVSLRRVDDSVALLMSADQTERFRDNLSLRVTMAQLALMTKQTEVWQTEMTHIISAIEQRFDPSMALTQRALALATKLADTTIDVKLPSLDNSLAVIESLKQADENTLEKGDVDIIEHVEPSMESTAEQEA